MESRRFAGFSGLAAMAVGRFLSRDAARLTGGSRTGSSQAVTGTAR